MDIISHYVFNLCILCRVSTNTTDRKGKSYVLYKLEHVIPCLRNLTEENFCVRCLNFSPAYEYQKLGKNRIQ